MQPKPHRKLVKHYEDPSHVRELTFSCYKRMPLLVRDDWRCSLSKAITAATRRHPWKLAAFVYMPEHVHLLVFPVTRAPSIDELLKAIKRPYSYRIKKILEAERSGLMPKLVVQQRPGIQTFRYWQEGPRYDLDLEIKDSVVASINYIHNNTVQRFVTRAALNVVGDRAHVLER